MQRQMVLLLLALLAALPATVRPALAATAAPSLAAAAASGDLASYLQQLQAQQLFELSQESPIRPPPPQPEGQRDPGALIDYTPRTRCGNGVCDGGENCGNCARDCKRRDGRPCQRVGMMYSGWHWPAWNAMRMAAEQNKTVLTVEDVLRSRADMPNGTIGYNLSAMLQQPRLTGPAMNFYWQRQPQDGPYCIYHRRQPGELNYNPYNEGAYQSYTDQPDCPGYNVTLARHARQLVAASVDFVVVDLTNLPQYSATSDAINLRPLEVLVQEWALLRARGIQTPDIAVWAHMPDYTVIQGKRTTYKNCNASTVMVTYIMAVMNQPQFAHMFMRDAATQKFLLFYAAANAAAFDPAWIPALAANGGADNVIVVPMWSGRGIWRFFSQCVGRATLSDAPCNQPWANYTRGTNGSQVAASASYQIAWASVTGTSTGTWRGYTLRSQFQTALQVQPDFLFIAGWNEHIAQPVPLLSGFGGHSMGLETDAGAAMKGFVDNYGTGFSRDIEPLESEHGGSMIYDILVSCLQVYRYGWRVCDDPTILCCQSSQFSKQFAYDGSTKGRFGMYAPTVVRPAGATTPHLTPLYKCPADPHSTLPPTPRPTPNPTPHPTPAPTPCPTPAPTPAPTPMKTTKKTIRKTTRKTTKKKTTEKTTRKTTQKIIRTLASPPPCLATVSNGREVKPTTRPRVTTKKTTKKTTTKKTTKKRTTAKTAAKTGGPMQPMTRQRLRRLHGAGEADMQLLYAQHLQQLQRSQTDPGTQRRHLLGLAELDDGLKSNGQQEQWKEGVSSQAESDSRRGLQAATPKPTPAPTPTSAYAYATSTAGCRAVLPGGGTPYLIGYLPKARGDNFLRALKRCVSADGTSHTKYSLSADCGAGWEVDSVLGYVH